MSIDRTAPPFGGAAARDQVPGIDGTAPPFGGAAARDQVPGIDGTAPPFGGAAARDQVPGIDALKARLPDHARDLRINLGVIGASTALTPAQAWSIALASAVTTRDRDVIATIEAAAAAHLSAAAISAARGAAAIMGMTNVYYRFVHFMGAEYDQLPARLRMQVIGNPGVDKLDFELACLAASAISGCERCVTSHEAAIRAGGGTKEQVQDAIRIAAVIHGAAIALG